jgi:hypothetical protein
MLGERGGCTSKTKCLRTFLKFADTPCRRFKGAIIYWTELRGIRHWLSVFMNNRAVDLFSHLAVACHFKRYQPSPNTQRRGSAMSPLNALIPYFW